MNKFEFSTEENGSQIKLYCREHIYGGSTIDKTAIQFDKRSLPELIKVLEQGDCINLFAEPTIKTNWDKIDYLIIDTPPGTSDEHLTIEQYLKSSNIKGAIIVTILKKYHS